jgi:hypothetical protein
MIRIVTALPFLASGWAAPLLWAISTGLNWAVTKYIYTPAHDEIILRDIARVNFVNQGEFDKAFLAVKLADKSQLSFDAKVKAVQDAHTALDNLALYQRRTLS